MNTMGMTSPRRKPPSVLAACKLDVVGGIISLPQSLEVARASRPGFARNSDGPASMPGPQWGALTG